MLDSGAGKLRGYGMWTTNEVDLFGAGGRRVHNRYYSQDAPSGKTCVLVAGYGYTIDSPYLYFSKDVAFDRGFTILAVDFEYSRNRDFGALPEREQEAAFESDVRGVLTFLSEKAANERLLFIGKSLGTTAIFSLIQEASVGERTIGAVWLTPAQECKNILRFIETKSLPSLVVTGSKDPVTMDVDFEEISRLEHVVHFSVEGADHSLETPERARTLRALGEYLTMLEGFVDQT